ncbi:hypothetical protein ACET3Z_012238 [Daucus carota]
MELDALIETADMQSLTTRADGPSRSYAGGKVNYDLSYFENEIETTERSLYCRLPSHMQTAHIKRNIHEQVTIV